MAVVARSHVTVVTEPVQWNGTELMGYYCQECDVCTLDGMSRSEVRPVGGRLSFHALECAFVLLDTPPRSSLVCQYT